MINQADSNETRLNQRRRNPNQPHSRVSSRANEERLETCRRLTNIPRVDPSATSKSKEPRPHYRIVHTIGVYDAGPRAWPRVCPTPPIPDDTSPGHVLVVRAGVSRPAGSQECVTHQTSPRPSSSAVSVVIKAAGRQSRAAEAKSRATPLINDAEVSKSSRSISPGPLGLVRVNVGGDRRRAGGSGDDPRCIDLSDTGN